MSKVILVIAAHPDDEVLGCGGTIARHVNDGDQVYVLCMTNGVSARKKSSANDIKVRGLAAQKASNILGVAAFHSFSFPDNRLDSIDLLEIVSSLETILPQINPEIIYTHHFGDLNIDHQITYKAVLTACRPLPGSKIKEIYSFEIPSSTDWTYSNINHFLPNFFVDISPYMERKRLALNAYSIEMRESPHARSNNNIEAISVFRGNSVGVDFAEAFQVVRIIK